MSAALPSIRGYRILAPLGEGGMGRVFLAEDETLERRVAIKMIAAPIAGEGAARARFLREARAMAGIEHPNVVRVYAFGEADGQPYIVMEYVEGETLAARLSRVTRLAISEALRIAREVALALAAAWSRGIVHRDVKPANILLDREDRVKVADFGLARPSGRGGPELTGAGTMLGTPHYISPEQARGEETDFRSDVYSLGLVLYEMLGGRKPFTGKGPVEVIAKHLSEPLPPIREACPDVPSAVATLVEAMAAKSAADRPASYPELLRDLTPPGSLPAPMASATSTLATLPRATKAAPPAAKPSRRRVALAAALLVVLGLLAFVLIHGRTRHGSFAVAVAPFYGADAESEKEGRVMTALVESELLRRLPEDDVDLLGVERVGQSVRSPRAARLLLQRLDVNVLVWGEALAFQGEVEVATRLTRRDGTFMESGDPTGKLTAGAASPIELRRARAAAVADEVAQIYRGR